MQTRMVKTLLGLLKRSGSSAARFESARTLVSLVNDEETIKGTREVAYRVTTFTPSILPVCADAFISLAVKEADNSVKLIALMRLQEDILPTHPAIIQTCVLDLLRVLASSDPTVRRVGLELVAAGTTSRVAPEVVQFLKKELTKSDVASDYRRDLLDALHACSMRFSEVATDVMNVYLDLLKSGAVSENLVSFIKYTGWG